MVSCFKAVNDEFIEELRKIKPLIIITIIIIYSIYRVLIPNGPKALYIIKNNNKILNL